MPRSLALRTGGALAALAVLAAATRGTAAPARTPATATPARAAADTPSVAAPNDSIAGEYLTIVGGCNDCHTPGWDQSNGKTPPAERLTGNPVGYRGPWGTSYAANLRLLVQRASEDRWVQVLTTADGGHGRPPMPYMNTARMSGKDLRAMYRYVKALGPRGERAPRALPPDSTPRTPWIWMVPNAPGTVLPTAKGF